MRCLYRSSPECKGDITDSSFTFHQKIRFQIMTEIETEIDIATNDACLVGSHAADSPTCAVPSCTNSIPHSEKLCNCHLSSISGQPLCQCLPSVPAKFFVFPTEEEDRMRWIRLIHRKDLLLSEQFDPGKTQICCRHFPDAMPTETNPDPVLNLSLEAEDSNVEMDASPLVTVNNTNLDSPYSAEDADMNVIIDDFQPSSFVTEVTIETTNSEPPEEDDPNLNGNDLEAPSPTETKMEESLSPAPASPLVTVSYTNSDSPYSAEEADMDVIIDDFQPSLAEVTIETTNSETPEEDDLNLNGIVLEAPSPTETKMEKSPSPTPASPLVTVNNTNSDSPYSAEEADMDVIIDDFQPSLAEVQIETSNSEPPEEDDPNLKGIVLQAPSPTETKMEESPSPAPAPLPEKGEKALKADTSAQTVSRAKEQTTSLPVPVKPVVGEQRQRRNTAKKNYSFSASSESEEEEEEEEEEDEDSEEDSEEESEEETRIYCKCGASNTDDMIGCDGPNCKHEWFHFQCVGIDPKKVPQGKWFCESCRALEAKESREKRKEKKWKHKLKQVCNEIKSKKITIQAASEAYGISAEVLSKHLSLESLLTKQEESRLVEMAVNMCKRGNWSNVQDSVLSSVKILLDVEEKMGVKRQHTFVKNLPAEEWWVAFCNRHPRMQQLREQYELPKQILNSADQNIVKKPNAGKNSLVVQDTIAKLCRKDIAAAKSNSLKRKHALKKINQSSDHTSKEQQATTDAEGCKMNALDCLEAIIVKKQRHNFQKRFKSGDEGENDLVYSAWRALRCLYSDSAENNQDDPNQHGVPPFKGDIPPWSPCLKGPFYVPDEASRTSLSLLIGNPGTKTKKKLQSRIQTMKVKMREHYLEPWRFRLNNNRKAVSPWKFQVVKRNRRKCFITRRLDSEH